MLISFEKACEIYNKIPLNIKCPSHDPHYVVIDSKRDSELKPTFFLYEDKGNYFYNSFHLSKVLDTQYYDIQSQYGYGGSISNSYDSNFLNSAWESFSYWCKQQNVLAEFVRFHPLLDNYRAYQGEVLVERDTAWISLENDLLESYQTRAKRKIKKATLNGLQVDWVDGEQFLEYFPYLYSELMIELDANKFYLFPESYFKKIVKWGSAFFALCKKGNDVVGAAIFYGDNNLMEYHLSASNASGREYGATSLLLHEAAVMAKKLGYKGLHLGGGMDDNPNNPLFFFKSGFSNYRGKFHIGKNIYHKEIYHELKSEWIKKHGDASNRILFYR